MVNSRIRTRSVSSTRCNQLFWGWVACLHGVLLSITVLAGCQKPTTPPQKAQGEGSAPATAMATANVSGRIADNHGQAVSQADLASQTGDPIAAVKVFLEAVRTGDDERVIQLFSEEARKQAGKLNRQFAPVGSDTARYEVFPDVQYLAPDGARVRSTWTDLDSQGKPRTDEITWMLRKESEGWRIAGMATVIFPGEPPLLLDFENMEETLRKIELLAQEIERRSAAEATGPGNSANERPTDAEADMPGQ